MDKEKARASEREPGGNIDRVVKAQADGGGPCAEHRQQPEGAAPRAMARIEAEREGSYADMKAWKDIGTVAAEGVEPQQQISRGVAAQRRRERSWERRIGPNRRQEGVAEKADAVEN